MVEYPSTQDALKEIFKYHRTISPENKSLFIKYLQDEIKKLEKKIEHNKDLINKVELYT